MKAALVFLALLAACKAEATQGEYGAPEHQPQTFKNVYIFSARDEPEDRQSRTIRVPGGDKHVNIIFVKTPSSSSHQQTEVILPEQDEQRSLIYVLLKKSENTADVKITRPQPKQQPRPEVNFIRYQDQQQNGYQQNQNQAAAAAAIQAPSPVVRTPSNVYGTNF